MITQLFYLPPVSSSLTVYSACKLPQRRREVYLQWAWFAQHQIQGICISILVILKFSWKTCINEYSIPIQLRSYHLSIHAFNFIIFCFCSLCSYHSSISCILLTKNVIIWLFFLFHILLCIKAHFFPILISSASLPLANNIHKNNTQKCRHINHQIMLHADRVSLSLSTICCFNAVL